MDSPVSFEIVFDPKQELVESNLLLDERHEPLIDGDWIRHARRVARIPDLFVYRHRGTGAFVLSKWLWRGESCMELDCSDRPPDRGGWWSDEYLVGRCRPVQEMVAAVRRKLHAAASQKRRMKEDDATERRELCRSLRLRGDDRTATMIETGQMPWVGSARGGQQLEEMREHLSRMCRIVR